MTTSYSVNNPSLDRNLDCHALGLSRRAARQREVATNASDHVGVAKDQGRRGLGRQARPTPRDRPTRRAEEALKRGSGAWLLNREPIYSRMKAEANQNDYNPIGEVKPIKLYTSETTQRAQIIQSFLPWYERTSEVIRTSRTAKPHLSNPFAWNAQVVERQHGQRWQLPAVLQPPLERVSLEGVLRAEALVQQELALDDGVQAAALGHRSRRFLHGARSPIEEFVACVGLWLKNIVRQN